ncbi:IPT/TIG domain-containing protein [Flagellimonas sp. HMM57]|uniref:IPT/TIG domain-containing protein n=1 Tax=unclassified Flagellimonas TaxID=2644544 RepID=UPI0013D43025|nr:MULTISPECIES: IPT/TIG domain-containing protein [unclassified Flagellimonas]UII76188.1 IPT/TIG domain-containing protein [Flagellimonas sp. HMM57]
MKTQYKLIRGLAIAFSALLIILSIESCEDEDFKVIPDEEIEQTITSIMPARADIGATVLIKGTDFSPVPVNNKVSFNEVSATVTAATDTLLTVTVPEGATTGPISVSKAKFTIEGPVFTVFPAPSISELSATGGAVGETIIIKGLNFGATVEENIVRFNSIEAEIINASATELEVKIPAEATTGPLTIEVQEQTATLEIFTIAPVILSFEPLKGAAGEEITISGTNFSSILVNNNVTFDGVLATVVSSTSTSLTVTVPPEAISGNIAVEIEQLLATSEMEFITVPSIESFTPSGVASGSEITINGANFGTEASDLEVLIGGISAEIVGNSFDAISVVVPNELEPGDTAATVTLAGQISEPAEFAIIPLVVLGFTSFEEVPTFGLDPEGDAFRYPRPAASQDPMPNIQDTDPLSEVPYVAFIGGGEELGFTAAFVADDVSEIENERLGVYNNTSINAEPQNFGIPFEDGIQGYVTSDLDGTVILRFDTMTNLNPSITNAVLQARVFFRDESWESGEGIEIFYETADGLGEPIVSILSDDVEAIAGASTLISVPFPTDKLQEGRLVVTFTSSAGSETGSLDYIAIKGVL